MHLTTCKFYLVLSKTPLNENNFSIASGNVDRIVQFTMLKLQSKPNEWRRILKTLNCIEFVIKNGSP